MGCGRRLEAERLAPDPFDHSQDTGPGTPGQRLRERFVGTVRRECLDRLVVLGRRHLEVILADYVKHYNGHRPHRSLDQQAPTALAAPPDALDLDMARLRSHDVLGGIIHEYRLVA